MKLEVGRWMLEDNSSRLKARSSIPKTLSKGLVFFLSFLLVNCNGSPDYLPKPKGYNRIELPDHSYQTLPDSLPYSFEYSNEVTLLRDSSWIAERYWVHLYYPMMDADIQVTYKPIRNLDSLLQGYYHDAYKLTSQHNVKAYSIEEVIKELPNGNFASISLLQGEVPSQIQFHVSDSTNNFLRGALYFKTSTKNDSLRPVINYLQEDIIHLLETLEWK